MYSNHLYNFIYSCLDSKEEKLGLPVVSETFADADKFKEYLDGDFKEAVEKKIAEACDTAKLDEAVKTGAVDAWKNDHAAKVIENFKEAKEDKFSCAMGEGDIIKLDFAKEAAEAGTKFTGTLAPVVAKKEEEKPAEGGDKPAEGEGEKPAEGGDM